MKYQELLKQARQDMIDMNRRHEQELKAMQQKLHASSDVAFTKFKQAAQEVISKQTAIRPHAVSEKQVMTMRSLYVWMFACVGVFVCVCVCMCVCACVCVGVFVYVCVHAVWV